MGSATVRAQQDSNFRLEEKLRDTNQWRAELQGEVDTFDELLRGGGGYEGGAVPGVAGGGAQGSGEVRRGGGGGMDAEGVVVLPVVLAYTACRHGEGKCV